MGRELFEIIIISAASLASDGRLERKGAGVLWEFHGNFVHLLGRRPVCFSGKLGGLNVYPRPQSLSLKWDRLG